MAGADKIDPAHWVSVAGGLLMMLAVASCSLSLMMPWWTEMKVLPGLSENTEVSLWIRYTRVELKADDSTLNCAKQCDFTKVGSAKVRETSVGWSDVCREAAGPIAKNCQLLWGVRVNIMLSWFLALLFSIFSTLNFCGAGLPASLRIPAPVKMGIALGVAITSALAILIAAFMDIRLQPAPPGTEPPVKEPAVQSVGLNGLGFAFALATCLMGVLGMAVAYLTQYVMSHLADLADIEKGRPLADVNRGTPPIKVGATPGEEEVDDNSVQFILPGGLPPSPMIGDNSFPSTNAPIFLESNSPSTTVVTPSPKATAPSTPTQLRRGNSAASPTRSQTSGSLTSPKSRPLGAWMH